MVHLPKTIDNDYMGIDFTFGYFTAAEFLATEMRNLNYDASAGQAYFICEAMGRSAGWLAYGAAIAGEACLVLSVEDVVGELRGEEEATDEEGNTTTRTIMNVEKLVERIVEHWDEPIDVPALIRYAKKRNVGIILYFNDIARTNYPFEQTLALYQK